MKKCEKVRFIPDLCLCLIFKFTDNDTLWCNIPLVSKRFNFILYNDVKNGLILRDCKECVRLIKKNQNYLLKKNWGQYTKNKEEYEKKFKILEKEITDSEKKHIENVKVNGLKKAVLNKEEECAFVCHKHYKKCYNCRINTVKYGYIYGKILRGILRTKQCCRCSRFGCAICIMTCSHYRCYASMCSGSRCSTKCCKCDKMFCNNHIQKLGKTCKCDKMFYNKHISHLQKLGKCIECIRK